jgi:hypothetical protein
MLGRGWQSAARHFFSVVHRSSRPEAVPLPTPFFNISTRYQLSQLLFDHAKFSMAEI